MNKIDNMNNAYKVFKPKIASQSYEKKQRQKMLARMGVAPSGRVSPLRTKIPNLDYNLSSMMKPKKDFNTRVSVDNLSKISLGFYTGASGMAKSNSKSKLIPSRHNHVLTDYRTRVPKSKSSHRVKGIEDVIYNTNYRELSPNLSVKSLKFPSIERRSNSKITWVPGGRHK
jgi:hypothetical protein